MVYEALHAVFVTTTHFLEEHVHALNKEHVDRPERSIFEHLPEKITKCTKKRVETYPICRVKQHVGGDLLESGARGLGGGKNGFEKCDALDFLQPLTGQILTQFVD